MCELAKARVEVRRRIVGGILPAPDSVSFNDSLAGLAGSLVVSEERQEDETS